MKISHGDALFISDLFETDAEFFHRGIREHWGIENSLHWVKDVIHKEDKNRIRILNGPMNAAILSSIAINIHRKNGNHSITDGIVQFNANFQDIFRLIST